MKKKLLFIIWSNSYGGGAEKQLTNLVNNLSKDKYEIDVIEYFHTNINPEVLADHINELKPINNKEKESKIKRYIINILVNLCPKIVRKLYIKDIYDLEVSFNYLIPTFLLSKDKKVKTISWNHGAIWDLKPKDNYKMYKLQKSSYANVDKIVAIAEETKKSIDTIYPEYKNKTMIINNGYDFDAMDKLAKEYKVTRKSDTELLYSNRFDNNKNPLLLIEALNILKEKNISFHLNFLGKGELESEMIKLIKDYKLDDFIDIIGYVKNPYPYYQIADIYCLTSKSEGFSTSLIEALHFKKTFISTQGGVTKEIEKECCGEVADTKEEYAASLLKLIKDKNHYKSLCENGFEWSKNYSLKNQVRETEKLIDTLIKE